MILIAIPVLARPTRAAKVVASIQAATKTAHRILFLCSLGDQREITACRETGADVDVFPLKAGPGDWAKKLNYAISGSDEPWIFLGADDLEFHRGWDRAALKVALATGAGVIGTNDLGNPRVLRGTHSTHSLLRRSYAELGAFDGGPILFEGYDHQYPDDELVATAKWRGAWAFAADSEVEHLHPYFKKSPWDETYRKALKEGRRDRVLFTHRRRLLHGSPREHGSWTRRSPS